MNTLPAFETERLILRGVTPEDIPAYKKYFVDYAIISQLSAGVPWPYPENGVEDYVTKVLLPIQGKDRWFWSIFLKTNPSEMIGGVDLWRVGIPEHRGFWLGKPFWGQGIMTEAVTPIMDYAFTSLGFDKLVFSNALGNVRSRRVKEKTGARLIGTRPAKLVDPAYTESETWELTKAEWSARRA